MQEEFFRRLLSLTRLILYLTTGVIGKANFTITHVKNTRQMQTYYYFYLRQI